MSRLEHDRRPTLEYERDTEDRFDHSQFVPGLYDKPGKPCRLRVFWSEDATNGIVNVIDENTTSESPTAEGLLPPNEVLLLTPEQARWLHRTLGALLPRLEAADAAVQRALAGPCQTCDGTKRVMRRPPYERDVREVPCPDCAR